MGKLKKYSEIVAETDTVYIALVWTGPNYYIAVRSKDEIHAYKEYLLPVKALAPEEVFTSISVLEMDFLCRGCDYNDDLVRERIQFLVEHVE